MKITFVKEKETPGTIRYRETLHDGEPAKKSDMIIVTLYVKKEFAAGRDKIVVDFPLDGEIE